MLREVLIPMKKKAFIVTTKHEKYVKQAKVLERLVNQPSVVELVERRMAAYFEARALGKTEEEALRMIGLDPSKPATTYGDHQC